MACWKKRDQRDEDRDAREHAAAVAEQEEWHDRERLRERRVDWVEPAGRDPVHLLDAVVHGVEAPELRDRVSEAVTPVAADEHEHDGERDRHRGREQARDAELSDPDERERGHDHQHDDAHRDEQVVHEQMRQVGEEAAPQHLLVTAQREQLLDRHEHQEQECDPERGVAPHHEGQCECCSEDDAGDETGASRALGIGLRGHDCGGWCEDALRGAHTDQSIPEVSGDLPTNVRVP